MTVPAFFLGPVRPTCRARAPIQFLHSIDPQIVPIEAARITFTTQRGQRTLQPCTSLVRVRHHGLHAERPNRLTVALTLSWLFRIVDGRGRGTDVSLDPLQPPRANRRDALADARHKLVCPHTLACHPTPNASCPHPPARWKPSVSYMPNQCVDMDVHHALSSQSIWHQWPGCWQPLLSCAGGPP